MGNIDRQSLIDRLMAYVQIDSETGDEGEMAKCLVEDFKALGCEVYTDDIKEVAKTTGCNVYATLKGDESLDPIMFSSHMDTVVPGKGIKPRIDDDGYIRSGDDTILGGDDKAGIAAIMEAMKAAKAKGGHRTVEAVITVREESGMFGAKNLEYSRIKSKSGIVLDSSGGPEHIITGAPGQNKISAVIIGKKAHAGVEPEAGISAIEVAAHAVSNMKLLRVDFETTCNIGTFSASGATNIVTERVILELEVRSRSTEKLEAHTKHIVDCMKEACEKFGGTLEHTVATSYLGYNYEDDFPLVQKVADAAKKLGLSPECKKSGGGSDANIYNLNGIETLNLGVGMEKVHTTNEQLSIEKMENASNLCFELMM